MGGNSLTIRGPQTKILFTRMRFYLSGAIEYSADHGLAWRAELTPFLRSFGHEVYDPALDVRKNLTEQEAREFRAWKTTELPRFQQTVRKIIHYDLDIVEQRCDAVICLWDEAATRGAGSHAELTAALRRGIPVYLVLGMPLAQVSGWILGCATEVFTDFESLRAALRQRFAAKDVQVVLNPPSESTLAAKPQVR